jgi:hypothetical protein
MSKRKGRKLMAISLHSQPIDYAGLSSGSSPAWRFSDFVSWPTLLGSFGEVGKRRRD